MWKCYRDAYYADINSNYTLDLNIVESGYTYKLRTNRVLEILVVFII